MKKLAITLCLSALASAAFAQGTVNFSTAAAQAFHTNAAAIAGATGNTASTLGGYYYEVLTAPSTVSALTDASFSGWIAAGWSDTGLLGTNTTIAGRASAGSGATVNNWAAGVQQSFVVVGWSANEGTTWASVAAKLTDAHFTGTGNGAGYWDQGATLVSGGFLGVTVMGAAQSGGGSSGLPAFSLFGTGGSSQGTPIIGTTELYAIQTVITPEPTSMALAGLGIAAGMILRRRSK